MCLIEVTQDQFDRLIAAIDRRDADTAAEMPDDASALQVMHRAFERLKQLGWRDGRHAPKDGTIFDSCNADSTGTHECFYAEGFWNTLDGGECYPSGQPPLLWRLKPCQVLSLKPVSLPEVIEEPA